MCLVTVCRWWGKIPNDSLSTSHNLWSSLACNCLPQAKEYSVPQNKDMFPEEWQTEQSHRESLMCKIMMHCINIIQMLSLESQLS